MIEKIKNVSNPLTVIAIFAGIAEFASTIALATVDQSIQPKFVWFVMLFPVFLVGCFFLTLNFNPKVLYSPRDFRKDETFEKILLGTNQLDAGFEDTAQQLETAKKEIVDNVVSRVTAEGKVERSQIVEAVHKQFDLIMDQLQTTREAAEEITEDVTSIGSLQLAYLHGRILKYLSKQSEATTSKEIADAMGLSLKVTNLALKYLRDWGQVEPVISPHEGIGHRLGYRLKRHSKQSATPNKSLKSDAE